MVLRQLHLPVAISIATYALPASAHVSAGAVLYGSVVLGLSLGTLVAAAVAVFRLSPKKSIVVTTLLCALGIGLKGLFVSLTSQDPNIPLAVGLFAFMTVLFFLAAIGPVAVSYYLTAKLFGVVGRWWAARKQT